MKILIKNKRVTIVLLFVLIAVVLYITVSYLFFIPTLQLGPIVSGHISDSYGLLAEKSLAAGRQSFVAGVPLREILSISDDYFIRCKNANRDFQWIPFNSDKDIILIYCPSAHYHYRFMRVASGVAINFTTGDIQFVLIQEEYLSHMMPPQGLLSIPRLPCHHFSSGNLAKAIVNE